MKMDNRFLRPTVYIQILGISDWAAIAIGVFCQIKVTQLDFQLQTTAIHAPTEEGTLLES